MGRLRGCQPMSICPFLSSSCLRLSHFIRAYIILVAIRSSALYWIQHLQEYHSIDTVVVLLLLHESDRASCLGKHNLPGGWQDWTVPRWIIAKERAPSNFQKRKENTPKIAAEAGRQFNQKGQQQICNDADWPAVAVQHFQSKQHLPKSWWMQGQHQQPKQ